MLSTIKKSIKNFVYTIIPPPSFIPLSNSYSQAGEDGVLTFLFADYGKRKITYLDLGTNLPDVGNNTYAFYRRGNTGVCVEADISLIDKIKQYRPKDTVINAGVAQQEGEADFFIFNIPSISTFDKKEAEYRASFGNYTIEKVVKIPLITINKIIKDHFEAFPDLLSIDIEGLDLVVLQSLDFEKYPIPVICVETCVYSENHIRPKDNSIREFLENKGYEVYADTYINTIFVNKNWFYNNAK